MVCSFRGRDQECRGEASWLPKRIDNIASLSPAGLLEDRSEVKFAAEFFQSPDIGHSSGAVLWPACLPAWAGQSTRS